MFDQFSRGHLGFLEGELHRWPVRSEKLPAFMFGPQKKLVI